MRKNLNDTVRAELGPVTKAEAVKEIARRKAPKGSAKRNAFPRAQVMGLPGNTLAAIAGEVPTEAPAKVAAVKAPAKVARKSTRTPAQKAATAARKLAYAHMIAEKQAGNECTWVQACADFGTVPASMAKNA